MTRRDAMRHGLRAKRSHSPGVSHRATVAQRLATSGFDSKCRTLRHPTPGFRAISSQEQACIDTLRGETKPSMRGGKSSGPVQRICPGSPRTSPSPSASVDLAHLRPRPRCWFVHPRHTSPEPEAEGETPRGPVNTLRADADVTVTLNHLSGVAREGRRQETRIQGTPPFNVPGVGDGAAAGLRSGVVQWSSRPPGHRLAPSPPHRSGPLGRPPGRRAAPAAATSGTPRRPSGGCSSSRRGASPPSPPAAAGPPPRSPSCRRPSS